jgi:hypothetical protein
MCRLARPKMLIEGLGCGFQNEATITASIQMPLDLTFHARRELPFQVPANQMDGIPTGHIGPTSSGPAWVGPFSSQQGAIRHGEKLFKLEHSGLAFAPPACLADRFNSWTLWWRGSERLALSSGLALLRACALSIRADIGASEVIRSRADNLRPGAQRRLKRKLLIIIRSKPCIPCVSVSERAQTK